MILPPVGSSVVRFHFREYLAFGFLRHGFHRGFLKDRGTRRDERSRGPAAREQHRGKLRYSSWLREREREREKEKEKGRGKERDSRATSTLIVTWRLARPSRMLPASNFNPFDVETISPRNGRKPGKINELKLDLRGEKYSEDQTAATNTTTSTRDDCERRRWGE